ncbi:cache domain-containing protein [Methylobacterium sp. NEAU 140]|uniref:cache domain-containing protein n=1 Tax=Methylobacterium sp. NEAU 140 TaxID=3064945 RepID=UPI0027339ACD|nr:cache domain-containing protein [Methylobacterium sp. NEAU 140]MDP4027108.1 cache domain-containing protein [Methylobacterium sp. NEAU 140]
MRSTIIRAALRAVALATFGALVLAAPAARACGGFVEAPIACDDPSPNGFAAWMLGRVTKAVATDKDKALDEFTRGTDGFRTADTYVFCVGPDGTMTAHPSPILRGHDVRDLHDRTGHYFIRTMMQEAKPGQISVIRYLFPKPGSTVEEPKTTYYTKAGDQTCGVGVYDADAQAPKAATPEARVAALRAKLDGQIPAAARADWTAFLEALNQAGDAQAAAVARARDSLKAADAALRPDGSATSADE